MKALLLALLVSSPAADRWPQFRGPGGHGIPADESGLPLPPRASSSSISCSMSRSESGSRHASRMPRCVKPNSSSGRAASSVQRSRLARASARFRRKVSRTAPSVAGIGAGSSRPSTARSGSLSPCPVRLQTIVPPSGTRSRPSSRLFRSPAIEAALAGSQKTPSVAATRR